MHSEETGLSKLTSLLEELSDEEAGACVGGTVTYDVYVDVQPVDDAVESLVGPQKILGLYATQDSFRIRGTWSDRNLKTNFATVDVQEILTKVATVPIETWNYKDQNPTIRHIGPMAQDFAAAFAVGEDNRLIHPVDANGVALAAIQALYQQLQDKDTQISTMNAELDTLKQQIQEIKRQLSTPLPVAALSSN
ncbi:MAG: tail fiber domain-containing protein [Coleofasciculus sp. G3-WIS-01]|uniref:tail fiber domain-containing protein n=1 Tax=Coleofasciculus sp. G3-WIS-01 TaxID=3069528 RepID=UPI0032F6A857